MSQFPIFSSHDLLALLQATAQLSLLTSELLAVKGAVTKISEESKRTRNAFIERINTLSLQLDVQTQRAEDFSTQCARKDDELVAICAELNRARDEWDERRQALVEARESSEQRIAQLQHELRERTDESIRNTHKLDELSAMHKEEQRQLSEELECAQDTICSLQEAIALVCRFFPKG